MSEYSSLKATINANVKANNNQEITGAIMNSVLNAMVNSLGAGYQYIGMATPTNPGSAQTPDYKCFYLATTPGTYTNLGGLVVADGEVAILKYDTSWTKEVSGIASADKLNQLGQQVIYDVSTNNGGTTFASLSALLSNENLSTLIPSTVRCGGMSIRFVQTSDNKYVQYRLMSDSFNTTVANWQGVDDVPTAGSNNLVKSGGVAEELQKLSINNIEMVQGGLTSDGEVDSSVTIRVTTSLCECNKYAVTVGTGFNIISIAFYSKDGSFETREIVNNNVYYMSRAYTYFRITLGRINNQTIAPTDETGLAFEYIDNGIISTADYNVVGTNLNISSLLEGETYIITNISDNDRNVEIYTKDSSNNVTAIIGIIGKGNSISFVIKPNDSIITLYSAIADFKIKISHGFGLVMDVENANKGVSSVKTDNEKTNNRVDAINAVVGNAENNDITESGTNKSVYAITEGYTYIITNTSENARNIEVYTHVPYVGSLYQGHIAQGQSITLTIAGGVDFVKFYSATAGFSIRMSHVTKMYGDVEYLKNIMADVESKWRVMPDLRILVIGDSFSAVESRWISDMLKGLPNSTTIQSMAVTNASVKDNYADRTEYPYTSRPVSTNNTGNLNTFACQIAKLKRLMEGTDLDVGESQIYLNEQQYPNIIIIEGGHNDGKDSDEKVATYAAQFETKKTDVYAKRNASDTAVIRDVYIKTPIESIDRTCFGGAYRYLVDELNGLFPNAQIFITTAANLGYWTGSVANQRKVTAEQQRECAALCSVSVIDWQKDAQISTITDYPTGDGTAENPYVWGEGNGTEYADTDDAMHPNARGARKLGQVASLAIKKNFITIT